MKTVQMTLEEDLLRAVDRVVKKLATTRSAFIREALRDALAKFNAARLENQHRQGYARHPVASSEFDVWDDEQVWEAP